jgi:hypothetical protein
MRNTRTLRVWLAIAGLTSMLGCDRTKDSPRESGAVTQDSLDPGTGTKGQVPLTTKSEEARKLYDRGLALSDQLRAHDARQLFQQAVP